VAAKGRIWAEIGVLQLALHTLGTYQIGGLKSILLFFDRAGVNAEDLVEDAPADPGFHDGKEAEKKGDPTPLPVGDSEENNRNRETNQPVSLPEVLFHTLESTYLFPKGQTATFINSSGLRPAAASSYRPSASAIASSTMAFGSRDDLILPRSPEPSDEFMKMAGQTENLIENPALCKVRIRSKALSTMAWWGD
jgi:hypothetical protein